MGLRSQAFGVQELRYKTTATGVISLRNEKMKKRTNEQKGKRKLAKNHSEKYFFLFYNAKLNLLC